MTVTLKDLNWKPYPLAANNVLKHLLWIPTWSYWIFTLWHRLFFIYSAGHIDTALMYTLVFVVVFLHLISECFTFDLPQSLFICQPYHVI